MAPSVGQPPPAHVAHVVNSVSRVGAGVGATVCAIVNEQFRDPTNMLGGGSSHVFALRDASAQEDLANWPAGSVSLSDGLPPARYGYAPSLHQALTLAAGRPGSVIHTHGLWQFVSLAAARVARAQQVPLIVSAHGMLEDWAYARGSWVKKALWLAYEKRCLQTATAIHVTSDAEAAAVRRRGITAPLAVVPLGVDEPPPMNCERVRAPRQVLFLSRLHPKKGVLELIEAWAAVMGGQQRSGEAGWELVIAGPDEVGLLAKAAKLALRLGASDSVRFVGELTGSAKWQQYRQASLFVLPSYSENFGLVVPEAMACGLPVITTTATPWQAIAAAGCGWIVEPGVTGVRDALASALATREQALAQMSAKALAFAARYRWPATATSLGRLYQWALTEPQARLSTRLEGLVLD